MKTRHPAALPAAASALCLLLATPCLAQNGNGNGKSSIPAAPVGWLNAYPSIVQTGTKPTLSWGITYPSVVMDYVDVIAPATVSPKTEVDVEVRVVGAGVTVSSNGSSSYQFVPTQATLSFDGGSYQSIFYGTNNDVKPSKVVWSKKKVQAGQKLRFGGRYYYNRSWGSYYHSDSGTQNVRTLVNGDVPPTTYPLHTAPSLEDFIKPYLDAEGRVKIGPMDVIVFMELTHSDSQMDDQGYDLQDMVLLVTFKTKNNNGHGNNIDGVDSSNPGNSKEGEDTDPNFDDEKK